MTKTTNAAAADQLYDVMNDYTIEPVVFAENTARKSAAIRSDSAYRWTSNGFASIGIHKVTGEIHYFVAPAGFDGLDYLNVYNQVGAAFARRA